MTNHDKNEIFEYLIADHVNNNLGPVGNFICDLFWLGVYAAVLAGAGLMIFSGLGSLLSIL